MTLNGKIVTLTVADAHAKLGDDDVVFVDLRDPLSAA